MLLVEAVVLSVVMTSIADVDLGGGRTGSLGAARAASWAASLASSFLS